MPISIFQIQSSTNSSNIGAPSFLISNLSAIWNNVILFTDFDEGIFATKCPTNSIRVFYMWDLDWAESVLSRKVMSEIVNKCDYLFVRDESFIWPVESFFGRRPDGVIENLNLEDFINYERNN